MTIVLGINTPTFIGSHDSSATLVKDGKIIAAIQEERMTGVKHQGGIPINSIKECMKIANLEQKDIDAVAVSWELAPFHAPRYKIPLRYVFKKMIDRKLKEVLEIKAKTYYVNHHLSHAASALFTSGFDKCTNIVMDGRGDVESASIYKEMERKKWWGMKESLGWFYASVTESLGFKQNDGEGKTMGLACYGKPVYFDWMVSEVPKIDFLKGWHSEMEIRDGKMFSEYRYTKNDASKIFRDQMETTKKPAIEKLKEKDRDVWQKYADMAASAQKYLETKVLELVDKYVEEKNVCLSGGVFLNCKLNQRIREKGFDVFIHPAAGDSGTQTGAALEICRMLDSQNFKPEKIEHTYFGTSYSDEEIEEAIKKYGLKYEKLSDPAGTAADLINKSKVVGWFQGRMEYGPRALGNRSVLADPTDPEMRNRINMFLKKRDWFMPFCPSMLDEAKKEYLIGAEEAPFMIMTFDVPEEKAKEIPAVVHVDGTVRPQTVKKEVNERYWRLIKEFEKHKVPLVLNTSFNRHGLPMIMNPEHALEHLVWKAIDVLIIGDFLVERQFV